MKQEGNSNNGNAQEEGGNNTDKSIDVVDNDAAYNDKNESEEQINVSYDYTPLFFGDYMNSEVLLEDKILSISKMI